MRISFVILVFLVLALPSRAHEFWISPGTYQVAPEAPVTVTTRIGENFKAASRPFLPGTFERYEAVSADQVLPVTGRIGDDPVAVPLPEGLGILVHESKDFRLTYKDPEKWPKFVAHKDLKGALAAHQARGFGPVGFSERYRRFAKSLVAVGHGRGADRAIGLRTEIVALANPYTETITEFPVQVLLEGQPRRRAQVELFARDPEGQVDITLHRTNDAGIALLPVRPGHVYLADAVVLRALDNEDPEAGPVWESLWASLTFAVPEPK